MNTKKYNLKPIVIIIILIIISFGFASCMSWNININRSGFSRIIQDFDYLDIRIDLFIYGPSSNSISIDLTIFDNVVSAENVYKLIQTISEYLESEQFIDYFSNRFGVRDPRRIFNNSIALFNPDVETRMALFSRDRPDEDFIFNRWDNGTFQGCTR